MSAASEVNLKQTLRKIEYPACVKEALNKVVELICGRITSIKHMDLALDLMAEFIFYEVDRRGNKRNQGLTPLLELQLLEILFEYFNNIPNESARNTVFLSLFSGTMANLRLGILSKLVSVAISIPSPTILMIASVWLQQLGNTSVNSCRLAEALIEDYFYFIPDSTQELNILPKVCPQFTANFMTAIAENYFAVTKKELLFPPKNLLDTITFWRVAAALKISMSTISAISHAIKKNDVLESPPEKRCYHKITNIVGLDTRAIHNTIYNIYKKISNNCNLCIAAQQKQAVLPPGAIAMEATTPIPGLLKWCILAPIYKQDDISYSRLHLALLNSILDIPRNNQPKAIYAQHLAYFINPISAYVIDLKNKQEMKLDQILNEDSLQLALDRFAQVIQVAYSVNCIYGHVDDLFSQLKQLPFNKLLSIVINTYKHNKIIVL